MEEGSHSFFQEWGGVGCDSSQNTELDMVVENQNEALGSLGLLEKMGTYPGERNGVRVGDPSPWA
jgi:hypothetical protein